MYFKFTRMKKSNWLLALTFFAVVFTGNLMAQVDVTSSGGTATASYTTLKASFDAINAGTHTGTIAISISASTTETASAVLNANGSGSASFANVSISPSGGAARTITGSVVGPLVDFNGASNVTINGLNTGGNALTISNTATGASSTIRYYNDASNNTVTNCTLLGSSTTLGVVYFGTSTGTLGNLSNTVSNNNIAAAGANSPLTGIYSVGQSALIVNSATVSSNNIYDYFNAAASTSGIFIGGNNNAWTITDNKLYQSATRTYTTANTHYGINITSGAGYVITGNTIGYANNSGTGTTNVVGNSVALAGFPGAYATTGTANATRYVGINAAFTAAGSTSSIQNNKVANIAIYTSSGATTTNGILAGIVVTSGNVNIGTVQGNTIGATTGNGSLYSASSTAGGLISGIYVTSSNTVTIKNNTVGAIDATGNTLTTLSGSIRGIDVTGIGNFLITNNTIGNSTANNLRMGNLYTGVSLSNAGTTFTTSTGASVFVGINSSVSGTITIGTVAEPNTIRNVFVNSNSASALFKGIASSSGVSNISGNNISNINSNSASVSTGSGVLSGLGIYLSGGTNPVISSNTISNLALLNTGTGGFTLGGISYTFPTTSITITKNKIYGLTSAGTGTTVTAPPTVSGIFVRDGGGATANISNNMISLGNGQATNTTFMGLWLQYSFSTVTTMNILHNSINIEGTVTAGALPTFGLYRGDFSATAVTTYVMNVKNNVFSNTRSAGTGTHVCIANNYGATASATNWGTNASDYNFYNTVTGNPNIGYWTSAQTFAGWKTASLSDANSPTASTSANPFPLFNASATGDLHVNPSVATVIESGGVSGLITSDDIDGNIRQGFAGYTGAGSAPDLGADEFAGISPAPVINGVAISPLGSSCSAISRLISATVTPGAASLTSVTLNYSFNGVAQTPITMAGGNLAAGSTWTATIPAAVPTNASVAWYVTTTDGTYSKASNTSSYSDATALNYVATASVTPNPVCEGGVVTLQYNLLGTSTATYCAIAAATSALSYFDAFTTTGAVSNINNTATGFSVGGYANYTNLTVSQKLGQAVSFNTLLQGTTVGVAIWVDWNQDGIFDPSERMYNTTGYVSTAAGTFTVPATAKLGTTRMRILMDYNASNPAAPCGPFASGGRGEAEDYTFLVLPSTVSYAWTDGVTTFTAATNSSTLTVNTSATYTATAYLDGCPLATTVQVNVTPLPSLPIVTNIGQCGLGVSPSNVVGGASYNWYATPTSTTVLQSGASSTYTTAVGATTTWYVTSVNGACESSPRVAVTASVTLPDAVNAASSASLLCVGGSNAITLTANQVGTNNAYSFTWTATPAVGSGMATSVTGQSVVITPTTVGTYTYNVIASDAVCTTLSSVVVTLNALPQLLTSATPSVVCSGASVNLNATNAVIAPGTATSGNGTSLTSAYGYPTAFGNYWYQTWQQYLFTAAELNAMGITAGNITSLSFSIAALPIPNQAITDYNIKIGSTGNTALSAFVTAGLTNVFGPATKTAVLGLNTITLSTPYYWNGTSNLVIDLRQTEFYGSGNATTYYTTTPNNSVLYAYATTSNANYWTSSPAPTASTSRPNIIFGAQIQTQGAGNLVWQWNPGAINSNTATVVVTNTTATAATQVFTVTGTNTLTGCSNTGTTSVVVNAIPTTPVAANSIQCGIGVPTASVSGGTLYNWYATPTSTTVLQTGSVANFTTSINSTTTWYVESVSPEGCSSPRAAVTETVNIPNLVTASTSSSSLCVGGANAITLTANQTGSTNNYNFTWTATPSVGSGITTSVNGRTVSITPTTVGTYTYNVTAIDGICTTLSSVVVRLNDLPQIIASSNPSVVCSGSSVNLTATNAVIAPGPAAVGTGTALTLSYSYPTAFGNYWYQTWQQYLFTAAELNAMGMTAGNITSLSFSISALPNPNTPITDYNIQIAPTSNTALSAFVTTGLSNVFGPTTVTAAAGLNTITLATPYNWDGVSNLVIDLRQTEFYGNGNATTYYTTTPNNSVLYAYATTSNANYWTSNPIPTTSTSRPNIIFGAQIQTQGAGGISWQWNPGAVNSNTATAVVTNTTGTATTQVFTVTGTSTVTGCVNTATTSVLVNVVPNTAIATNSTQCGLGVPTAFVTGGTSYNWYATPTSTTIVQAGPFNHITSPINTTTTWYVNTFNGLCESLIRTAVTQTVVVPDGVTAVTTSSAVCPGTTYTLSSANTGTTNVYAYSWSASPSVGSGISSTTPGANVVLTPNTPGTYVYNVTATDGFCTTTKTVSVLVNAVPDLVATASPSIICSGTSVNLNVQANNATPGLATVGFQGGSTTINGSPYRQGAGTTLEQKAQYLFTAAELNAYGIYQGNITDISINALTAGSGQMDNFIIKMGATTASSLGTTYSSAASTLVYGPYSYSVTAGQNTHTFDTPFFWDGNSNVVIEICHDAVNPLGVSSNVVIETTSNKVITSTILGACSATVGTATTNRPQITFGAQVGSDITGSMNILWNPGAITTNTALVTPLNTGSVVSTQVYTVSVNNPATTCSSIKTVAVVINPIPTTPVAVNSAQCGVAVPTASVSGGTVYNWYATPTATTVLQTGSSSHYTTAINSTTSWYVTSMNTAGCESPRATVTTSVTVPDAVSASVASASVCPGTNATLIATQTGSTNVYVFTWTASSATGSGISTSVVGSSVNITPSTSGNYNYTLTASDAAGCIAISTTSLNVFVTPTLTAISAAPTTLCSGNTATLSISAISPGTVAVGTGVTTQGGSGLSPYAQFWEGQRTQYLFTASELSAMGLSSGNMSAISFNVTSAPATLQFTNYAIKMYHTSATDLVASYASPSSAVVNVFGPVNLAPPAVGLSTHNFTNAFTWDGVSNVIIDVCFENDPLSTAVLYTSNDIVAATTVTGFTSVRGDYQDNSSLCNTANVGISATSTIRPNVIFLGNTMTGSNVVNWSAGTTPAGTGYTITSTPPVTSVYTATLTDSHSCAVVSSPVTLTVNATPTITAVASSPSVCAGSTATLTATGATNYTWTSGGTTSTEVVTPSTASVYTVTGASLGCVSSTTVGVGYNVIPTVAVNSGSICSGNNFTITPTGASSYSYSGGSDVVSPLTTTDYTVTGTTAGCSSTAVSSVSVSTTPTISLLSGGICPGDSYTITASGADTYTYSSGSAVVTPVATTSYSVTGSNLDGCIGNTAVTTVTVSSVLIFNVNSGAVCAGNSFTMSPVGAATYTYSSGSAVVTPSASSVYTITGASASGCLGTATSSVTVNAYPVVTVNSGAICSGNSFTMIPSGATTYSYSSGSDIVSPTATTSYTVTGETAGCATDAVSSVTVIALPVVTAASSNTSICIGNSATLTAAGATNYTWTSGGTASTETVTPTSASVYTVTGESNGCSNIATVAVNVSTVIPTVTAVSSSSAVCAGSSATLTAGGANAYTWSTGGNATTEVVTPSTPSSYTVTGDLNGCTNTAIVSVGVNQGPTVTASASQSTLCLDGSNGPSILTASTTASAYTWSNGANTLTTSVTPTLTTTYTVTATQAGCSSNALVTVTVFDCTGIKELTNDNISIFPNPTNGIVNISISYELAGNTSIEVYDAIGKLVIKENLTNNTSTINLSKVEDGMYVFKIINNNRAIKIGKVVKQ